MYKRNQNLIVTLTLQITLGERMTDTRETIKFIDRIQTDKAMVEIEKTKLTYHSSCQFFNIKSIVLQDYLQYQQQTITIDNSYYFRNILKKLMLYSY